MPISIAAQKLKRLRRRFGIGAPRVAIRTHIAWYWRALMAVVVLSTSFVLAAWIYDAGRSIAGYDSNESSKEIQSLRNYVMELDSELTKLRGVAGAGESRLQIEQAALRQLSSQVKMLELENAELKQDLAFFRELMPSANLGNAPGVKISHFLVEPTGLPGEYRYRLLLVNNGGRQSKDARGNLQLVVETQQNGKDAMILFPSGTELNPQRFHFEIKHFQRLEGGFSVQKGVVVRSVEARLIQDGSVRAKQVVVL